MPLKNSVLATIVSLFWQIKICHSQWFQWNTDSATKEPEDEFCIQEYPYPSFVEDIVVVMVVRIDGNEILNWIKDHPWIYAVIGGTALLLAVLVIILIVICCCYCKNRKGKRVNEEKRPLLEEGGGKGKIPHGRPSGRRPAPPTPTPEEEEKSKAIKSVKIYLRHHQDEYSTIVSDQPDDIPEDFKQADMGSRMQKYWFKVYEQGGREMLATSAPVSLKCPLKLDDPMLRGVNKLITALRQHPYLHKVKMIDFRFETQQVVIVQPFIPSGSLKDHIYKVHPSSDWSRKYSRRSTGLPVDKVRRYGRQILEAVLFLYSRGFPLLGHIQSGNVFIDEDDVCQLGGFENTLLGYKTRLYRLCRNHLVHFDIIMFGHLMFEMGCGYELTQLRPGHSEYDTVKDSDLKEILDFIFREGFTNTLEKIKNHHFFSVKLPEVNTESIVLSDQMTKVLSKVSKNKPREQPRDQFHATGGIVEKLKQGIKKSDKSMEDSQSQSGAVEGVEGAGSVEKTKSGGFMSKFKLPRRKSEERIKVGEGENLATVVMKSS